MVLFSRDEKASPSLLLWVPGVILSVISSWCGGVEWPFPSILAQAFVYGGVVVRFGLFVLSLVGRLRLSCSLGWLCSWLPRSFLNMLGRWHVVKDTVFLSSVFTQVLVVDPPC